MSNRSSAVRTSRRLLLGREQIDQQRAELRLVENAGDQAVARAVPAAAAPVGEHDEAVRIVRQVQVADDLAASPDADVHHR